MRTQSENPIRGEKGLFRKGHHMGRPRKGSVLINAIKACGHQPEDVRKNLVATLLAAAADKEDWACKILADRLLPPQRTIGELMIFQGCRTPVEFQAAILGAVSAGTISPTEANALNAAVRAFAEASEWGEVRAAVAVLAAAGVRGVPALPRPPETVAVPNVDPLS